jgi:integrase/recombinase XerD
MGFSCKIVLAARAKEDKTRMVYLQAIINRLRALVPLGFCLKPEQFQAKSQLVRNHPAEKELNDEIAIALAKAHKLASKARQEEKLLTPELFRTEFNDPSEKADVIKFIRKELSLKAVSKNTRKRHVSVINKLDAYRRANKKKLGVYLAFQQLSPEFIQSYKQHLLADGKKLSGDGEVVKKGNKITTVNKELSIIKEYLAIAIVKGISFKDPFTVTKIKHFKSSRLGLSQKEVDRLERYYLSTACEKSHKRLLQYFLFSCYTGLRISDIKSLSWNDIHDNIIVKQLKKGEDNNPKETIIPLSVFALKFLPAQKSTALQIFTPFSEQYCNRTLKEICGLEVVNIKKVVTYHTSRHTFGSLFANGGDITALQKIMGHGSITTTMGYVHKNPEDLIKAVKDRFGE